MCPHKKDMVLARGLLADADGVPKVACPLHKKTFGLNDGAGLSDPGFSIARFDVKVEGGEVFVKVPPPYVMKKIVARAEASCATASSA